MKKFFALFIALTLCLTCAAAHAAGLSGLGGGGLDGLIPAKNGPLPDPSEALGELSTLLQENYAFADDYICDAYIYSRPGSVNNFVDKYTQLCRDAGYTLAQTTVDGADGYSIQNGSGKYALLVPDFDGQRLLLVQKGMDFTPEKRTNYATCLYNGRECELTASSTDTWAFANTYKIMFKAQRAPFKYITLYFTQHARSVDEFYVDKNTFIEGFEVSLDNETWLVSSQQKYYGGRDDEIESSKDFGRLVITTLKDTEDGILVEGKLSGSFGKGSTVIEDFVFSAVLDL